jgi:hypothetical protein
MSVGRTFAAPHSAGTWSKRGVSCGGLRPQDSQGRYCSPETLPVEQASKFDLVINFKAAKALGVVVPRVDDYVTAFFDYLAGFEEAAALFSKPKGFEEAERLKHDHLIATVQGDYGKRYVDQELRLAMLYSDAGLDARAFLGAYHHLMALIGSDIMARFDDDPASAFKIFISLKKIGSSTSPSSVTL